MKKYITEDELEKKEPIKPKYFTLKKINGLFLFFIELSFLMFLELASIIVCYQAQGSDLITADYIHFMLIFIPAITLLMLILFNIIYRNNIFFFRDIQYLVGLREYTIELREYHNLVYEYKKEQKFLKLKKEYSDYV